MSGVGPAQAGAYPHLTSPQGPGLGTHHGMGARNIPVLGGGGSCHFLPPQGLLFLMEELTGLRTAVGQALWYLPWQLAGRARGMGGSPCGDRSLV